MADTTTTPVSLVVVEILVWDQSKAQAVINKIAADARVHSVNRIDQ